MRYQQLFSLQMIELSTLDTFMMFVLSAIKLFHMANEIITDNFVHELKIAHQ